MGIGEANRWTEKFPTMMNTTMILRTSYSSVVQRVVMSVFEGDVIHRSVLHFHGTVDESQISNLVKNHRQSGCFGRFLVLMVTFRDETSKTKCLRGLFDLYYHYYTFNKHVASQNILTWKCKLKMSSSGNSSGTVGPRTARQVVVSRTWWTSRFVLPPDVEGHVTKFVYTRP